MNANLAIGIFHTRMHNSPNKGGLFTVVMEFEGTTSVSQFVAEQAADALKLWLARLGEPNAYGLSGSSARHLETAFADVQTAFADDPSAILTPIENVASVWWCTTASLGGKLALLNLVKTPR